MPTAMIDTTEDIDLATLSAAERAAHDADARLLTATRALDAATAELEAARRVAGEASTSATRSALVRAQRQLARTQEAEILASEHYRRAQAAAEADGKDQFESDVVALQRRIRSAVQAAATAVGLHAQLAAALGAAGLPPVGPPHLAALGDFATAARALAARMDAEQWPKLASNRNTGGSDHV